MLAFVWNGIDWNILRVTGAVSGVFFFFSFHKSDLTEPADHPENNETMNRVKKHCHSLRKLVSDWNDQANTLRDSEYQYSMILHN
jgi:hypothetical protein